MASEFLVTLIKYSAVYGLILFVIGVLVWNLSKHSVLLQKIGLLILSILSKVIGPKKKKGCYEYKMAAKLKDNKEVKKGGSEKEGAGEVNKGGCAGAGSAGSSDESKGGSGGEAIDRGGEEADTGESVGEGEGDSAFERRRKLPVGTAGVDAQKEQYFD